jgi:hypothetical protein
MLDFFRHYCLSSEQELEKSEVRRSGYRGGMAPDNFQHYFSPLVFLFAFESFIDCFKDQNICSLDGSVGLSMIN